MSVMQRALEKAEREGRLPSWTRSADADTRRAVSVDVLPTRAKPGPVSPAFEIPVAETDAMATPASPLLVAVTTSESPAANQFRLLRSRLEARSRGRGIQLILVTSPRVGDGKTTTSANLALTMAQDVQHTVVLLEADLRRPRLAALFGIRGEPGLIDVLTGGAAVEEALVRVPGQHLVVLPAGLASARSGEVLASSMLRHVVDGLRARFTRIIVDSPPLAVADTHELARVADGLLLVARAGVTPRPALERALAALEREKVMGFVLNEVDEVTDHYAYPDAERATAEG